MKKAGIRNEKNRTKKGEKRMSEKMYYNAAEIAAMLDISMGKSYKILRDMNKTLADQGFLTIAGKVPVEYFKEKWYGASNKKGE